MDQRLAPQEGCLADHSVVGNVLQHFLSQWRGVGAQLWPLTNFLQLSLPGDPLRRLRFCSLRSFLICTGLGFRLEGVTLFRGDLLATQVAFAGCRSEFQTVLCLLESLSPLVFEKLRLA